MPSAFIHYTNLPLPPQHPDSGIFSAKLEQNWTKRLLKLDEPFPTLLPSTLNYLPNIVKHHHNQTLPPIEENTPNITTMSSLTSTLIVVPGDVIPPPPSPYHLGKGVWLDTTSKPTPTIRSTSTGRVVIEEVGEEDDKTTKVSVQSKRRDTMQKQVLEGEIPCCPSRSAPLPPLILPPPLPPSPPFSRFNLHLHSSPRNPHLPNPLNNLLPPHPSPLPSRRHPPSRGLWPSRSPLRFPRP